MVNLIPTIVFDALLVGAVIRSALPGGDGAHGLPAAARAFGAPAAAYRVRGGVRPDGLGGRAGPLPARPPRPWRDARASGRYARSCARRGSSRCA